MGFDLKNKEHESFMENKQKEIKSNVFGELKKSFRPEFLNRVDQVIAFRALSKDDIRKIVDLQLNLLNERLEEQHIILKVDKEAKELLVEKGFDIDNGARPLRRTIQDLIEDSLASAVLRGEITEWDTVEILREGDNFKFKPLVKTN